MSMDELAHKIMCQLAQINNLPLQKKLRNYYSGELDILRLLVTSGSKTPGELTNELGMSSAHVAKALVSLKAKDEVERITDSADKRKAIVTITEKGKTHIEGIYTSLANGFEKLTEKLGTDDSEELLRLLAKIYNLQKEGELWDDSIKEYR